YERRTDWSCSVQSRITYHTEVSACSFRPFHFNTVTNVGKFNASTAALFDSHICHRKISVSFETVETQLDNLPSQSCPRCTSGKPAVLSCCQTVPCSSTHTP